MYQVVMLRHVLYRDLKCRNNEILYFTLDLFWEIDKSEQL